jgi:hypothetical protein
MEHKEIAKALGISEGTSKSPQPGTLTAQPPAQRLPLSLGAAEASPVLQSGPTPKDLARLRPIRSAPTTNHTHFRQTPAAMPQDSLLQPVPDYTELAPASTAVIPPPPTEHIEK